MNVVRALWWLGMSWVACAALGVAYFAAGWLTNAGNPYRHEAAIGAAFVAFYSWPGIVIAIVVAWKRPNETRMGERRFVVMSATAIVLLTSALSIASGVT